MKADVTDTRKKREFILGFDKDKNSVKATVGLRRQAEERLKAKTPESGTSPPDTETKRLLHELQVHQIELEMQNAELRQTREELEMVLKKYTDLYDSAPVGYFSFNRKGEICTANLSGAVILGIERAMLLGQRFGLLVTEDSRPLFAEFLDSVFAQQSKESCEVTLKTEGKLPLIVQIEAIVFEPGQECHAALIDITERKRAEELLRDSEERLQQTLSAVQLANNDLTAANIELEAFNYSVSHDLHSPLTIINGFCQIILDLSSSKLDAITRGYIQGIYDGSRRMNRLIDVLLNFSRIKRMEMQHDKVDLSKMAEDVATNLNLSDSERRVTFRIADGMTVNGDAVLLRSVLENLIGNAWKYTDEQDGAIIEFGATEIDGQSAFFVKDNGSGFDMAYQDKLFIPFQRLPGTKAVGHGIGLATVDRIIRCHGGRIWAEGETGKGACFYFTLGAD